MPTIPFLQSIGLAPSVAAGASLNIPHGVAPSAPANGDVWTTSTALFARINGATVRLSANLGVAPITFGGSVATGTFPTGTLTAAFIATRAGTITGWRLDANAATNMTLDIWKAAGANPTVANSITPSGKPALAAASVGSGGVAGWTSTAVAVGDIIYVNVDSNSAAASFTLVLTMDLT